MKVPGQRNPASDPIPLKGASARTRALMISTATEMMRRGASPSVSEVAEAAGVSRSTAYRYFPTLSDMLRAVVAEALGPILEWDGDEAAGADRIGSLYGSAFPRLFEHEATFRAALRQSLEPEADDTSLGRGHRRDLLNKVVGEIELPPAIRRRLVCAMSLTFGVEAMIVLKDICGLKDDEAQDVALWGATALLAAARREAAGENV